MIDEKNLTDTELISYLLQKNGDEKMKGVIRAKGSCPVCEGKFAEVKKLGYICPNHKTLPKRFFVDLFYKGKRLKLYSDRQGICLDTYQRAQTLLHQINSEIKNHTFDPAKYVKQEQERFYTSNLLDRFRMFKIDSLAPSYKKDFERHIRHAKNFFGAKDVRELRKLDILNYKDHLEKKFQLSNKTIKNIIDIFKTFLRYVKDDLEIISVVPGFPKIEQQPPKTTWLTPEVQQRLYESIPDEDKPIFAFLILSGCRPGEARALRCKDINLDLQIITISATFSGRVYRETRKGRGSRNATIPIHPEMLGYIKNHIENCLPSNYVFLNPRTGKYYSENTLKKIWQITKKKNNLPEGVRLYDATRHSFASQLVSRGVSLINVSRLLGHSSVKMTERYTHADLEKLKIDVENLSLRKIMTVPNVSPIANAGL